MQEVNGWYGWEPYSPSCLSFCLTSQDVIWFLFFGQTLIVSSHPSYYSQILVKRMTVKSVSKRSLLSKVFYCLYQFLLFVQSWHVALLSQIFLCHMRILQMDYTNCTQNMHFTFSMPSVLWCRSGLSCLAPICYTSAWVWIPLDVCGFLSGDLCFTPTCHGIPLKLVAYPAKTVGHRTYAPLCEPVNY